MPDLPARELKEEPPRGGDGSFVLVGETALGRWYSVAFSGLLGRARLADVPALC